MDQERITLTDTPMNMITKIAEGNPGAIQAIMSLMEVHDSIDPQSALGSLSIPLSLDDCAIYGSSIYVLFSYKCGRDPRKMIMLLRAVQLGFLSESKLREMAADQSSEVNLTDEEFNDLDSKVCDRLDGFAV